MDYLRLIFATFLFHVIFNVTHGFHSQTVSPRTCVIGAGYSGLATARHLKEYNMDFTVFESSKYVGGDWHFDPRVGVDEDGIPIFTKMYKNLRSNSPCYFTEFHEFPLPAGTSTYPSSECIFKYLTSFATKFGLLQHIRFRKLVTLVKRIKDQWQLTYWRGDTKDTFSEICDYIVIATGKYNIPVWPEIQGAHTFQGNMSHSYSYRDPEVYRKRRVLIVGAGSSGKDLASQISKVASKLVHSHHQNGINLLEFNENYVKKPDIKSFTYNGVIFNDDTFEEVDDVIYCTGYYNWHPFLDESSGLIRTKKFILPLYRKVVNIKNPSMLFVGATRKIVQKVLDAQGNYAASLIARRFQLPSEDEMMKSWINEANLVQNIEDINVLDEHWSYYWGNLSQEAGIPTLPPVFDLLIPFQNNIKLARDFINFNLCYYLLFF